MTRTEYAALKETFEAYVTRHFDNVEDSFVQVDGVYRAHYIRGAFDMFIALHTIPAEYLLRGH